MTATRTIEREQEIPITKKEFSVIDNGVSISEDIRKVLEKFAKKMEKEVVVMRFPLETESSIDFKSLKNKILILNPINIREKIIHNNFYPVNFYQFGEHVNFLNDGVIYNYFNSTPTKAIYVREGLSVPQLQNLYFSHIIRNEIFLLFDLLSPESQFKDDFARKSLLCHLLKEYEENGEILFKRVSYDRRFLNDYMRWMGLLKSNSRKALKDKISGIQLDLHNYWTAINKRERELVEAQAFYTSISRRLAKNKYDTDEKSVDKMLEPLLVKGKYKKFEFNPLYIKAYTGPIDLSNYKKKFHIGEFLIEIFIDGNIKFYNLTNKKEEYDHPHILNNIACLGNIKESVSKMILNFNFLPLFDLLYDYLTSYNEEGPYIKLERGWGVAEDWCRECDHPSANCQCRRNFCEVCNMRLENCRCARCPENNAVIIDDYCEGCESYNSKDGACEY